MPTEFEIDPNAQILIDFSQPGVQPVSGVMRMGPEKLDDLAEKSQKALNRAMSTVYQMAQQVTATMKALPPVDLPNNVEIEFGLKLDAEAGAYIVKSGIEATIRVTLAWERPEKPVATLPGMAPGLQH